MKSIRRVVFVEPRSQSPNVYSGIHIPRTGAVLLATLLREAGYETKVFCEDIAPLDEEEIFSADVVGISSLTNTALPSYALAAKCRERGIPVVMGGTHATFVADEALDHADFVVKGEGEAPLLELLRALGGAGALGDIANLSYWSGGRHGRGRKVHNPNRGFVQNLDALPIPDFGLVHRWGKDCIASIMTSRGCPYHCTFCSVTAMLGRGYRYLSEDRVLEEVRRYRDRDYIFFCDDNFAVNRKRTKAILRRKIEEGLDMKWSAQVRAEVTDDRELIRLMRESNCFNVYIGFESFNPKTLALFNKRMDVGRIQQSMEIFHKHRIKVHGMFVLGSDADDVETVRSTVRLAKRLDIDTTQFMILTPIPGAVLTDEFRAEGRIRTRDWNLFDGHYVTYEPRRLTAYELQRETLRAFRKFYSLPRVIGSALRGDKWVALLRMGARRYVKRWQRQNRRYLERLREEVLTEARRLAAAGRYRMARCIALPEGRLPRHLERFIETFFAQLGVKTLFVRVEGEGSAKSLARRAAEALERLRRRADLLVLPAPRQAGPEGALLEIQASPALAAFFHLPLGEDGLPSYNAFARLGMLFSRRIRRVNRAFEKAIGELEALRLPVV